MPRRIEACPLPAAALLSRYAAVDGYTDAYCTDIEGRCSHAEFVEAFYTTPLFRLERLILHGVMSRPSSDAEARQLARGERQEFAAWRVEARAENQILLADVSGRTRSWLMTQAVAMDGVQRTRLYFGSAVLPRRDPRSGQTSLGWAFSALIGFHRLYSRALLAATRARLDD